jgi:hypothetical protein
LPAPKEIPQLPQSMHTLNPQRIMDFAVVNVGSLSWELLDFGFNRVPRDEYTDAGVRYIKSMQTPAGNWETIESRRPPMAAGAFQTAALAAYALRTYGPPAEKADTEKVLARAARWMETAPPATTYDRVFQLMGLAWSNASPAAITSAAKALAAAQRSDGGWSQLDSLGSDAFATGQALYALNASGQMRATDPAYVKGVKYLVSTQAADGSWFVRSRSIWLQPYFDSGFPYGTDQWISAAATSWASMALSLSVDATHAVPRRETGSASNNRQ